VPYRKTRRPLQGIGVAIGAFCPIAPDVAGACDLPFDQTAGGSMLTFLNVVDEFRREALATEVPRFIDADQVVAVLERTAVERATPRYLRLDHSGECIA